MTGRFSKRGRNPGAVDCWLDSLGYYRKNVAYDETCLFRAVSEQLFDTQIHHEEVRKGCIAHGREHWRDFQYAFKWRDWLDRLEKLSIHMVVCTDIEIQLTCDTYRVDATVFKGTTHDVQIFSSQHGEATRTIFLCKMGEDHYDAVYAKEHIITAGFCQSVIYKVLYENVFEIEDVDSIVNSMLHDKQAPYTIYCPEAELLKKEEPDPAEAELSPLPQNSMLAPFPFKIAKALDPTMYRNIEYDTWLELRRELRLGEWYYGDDKLILGTRCILTRGNEELQCYIQEMHEHDETKCEVYITKLAQRLTVSYADLRPEEDAKPWPLPYRFARNQPVTVLNNPSEGDRKGLRKRREKKSHSEDKAHENQEEDVNVSNYEGCPLLMQKAGHASSVERLNGILQARRSPEPLESRTESMRLSETMSWSQAYAPQEIYQNPTISETSYQNTNDAQYVYTYGTNPNYSSMPVWSSQPNYVMSPDSSLSETSFPSPVDQTGQKYVFYQPDSAYASPTYVPTPVPSSPVPAYPAPFSDRVCAPTSPQIEVYPVYPITPGTPVFYAPMGTQVQSPRPEYMVQPASSMALYTPPVEMQYMPSPAYVYPPTPPVAWYNSPPVNSQGFIFPQPATSVQNVSNYA